MAGRRLDNSHPYGMRVATGGGKSSAAVREAATRGGRKADQLLAKLTEPSAHAKRKNGAARAARRTAP